LFRVWIDSGKASSTGSAKEFKEHGFSLIVRGVRGCDLVEKSMGLKTGEELQTRAASGGFDRKLVGRGERSDVAALNMKLKMMLGSELLDECEVGVGVSAAERMMKMHNRKDAAQFVANFEQRTEECDGIGASGDGDADAISSLDEPVLADELEKLGEQANIIVQGDEPRTIRNQEWKASIRAVSKLRYPALLPPGEDARLVKGIHLLRNR